jgi:hypothetical protein
MHRVPDIASALKTEISRLARKQLRSGTDSLRKAVEQASRGAATDCRGQALAEPLRPQACRSDVDRMPCVGAERIGNAWHVQEWVC